MVKNTDIRPILTEKTLKLAKQGWFTFALDTHLRKEEIRSLISRVYNVSVVDVRTVAMHGKVRRSGRSQKTRTLADWKKAMVRLTKGQSIEAFQLTETKE